MSVKKRSAEAYWCESHGYWQVKVQRDGTRRCFTSSLAGRRGKHEAEAKADAWLASGEEDVRFPDAWRLFLEWQQEHYSRANYIKHEQLGRLYIAPVIGTRKLSAVTPILWQRCIDGAARAGLSQRSCANVRGSITSFLTFARRQRWTHERLEDGDLTVPRFAAPEKPKHALTTSEIRTLFTEATITHYGRPVECHYIYAWRFLVATGLRRGELCGLRVEDVSDGILTVRRSVNSLQEVTPGKNRNAQRAFVLTRHMQDILADQRDMLERLGLTGSPWLFPSESGGVADSNVLYDRWRTYAAQHDINASLHELRHTFISLNKSDLPLELMKSVVGHSASMDTIGVYGHEVDTDKARAAAIIDDVFSRILDPSP